MTAATTPRTSRENGSVLPLGQTLAFSATSLPIAALVLAIVVHLPAYFASSIGVPLAVVSAAFVICRTIDIPVEPALGLMMDRTRTRFGRYRLWTVIGAPLMMLGLVMLTFAREGVGQVYLIGWLMVMYLGQSILILSHAAWAATLATSYTARARIFGIMGGVGVIGSLGVLAIPILMEARGFTDAEGVRAMIWYVILLTPAAVGLVVWRTPETIAPEVHGQRFRLRDYADLITHPSMWRILLADFCLVMGPGWMGAMFLFFNRDRMGFTTGEANALLAVYILAGLFGAPATGWVAARIGKHRAAMLSSFIYCLALVSLLFLPKGNVLASIPTNFVTGFLAAGFGALIRAMVADVSDDIRLTQGKERAGLLFSLTTSTNKIALATAVFISFQLLQEVGYDPTKGAANTHEALEGLTLTFLVGPIIFLGLGAASMIGYPLTAARAAETRRQLDERDAELLGKAPAE